MIFISSLLRSQYFGVYTTLNTHLSEQGILLHEVTNTRDSWIRDYFPVQVAPRRMVKFVYDPDYLRGYSALRTEGVHHPALNDIEIVTSNIVLDGGNAVVFDAGVMLTEKVFKENPDWARSDLLDELERLFERTIHIFPREPYDLIGHTDGMVRILENTIVINDYESSNADFSNTFCKSFERAVKRVSDQTGYPLLKLPYHPSTDSLRRHEIAPATGNYANFLYHENLLLVPTYGIPTDDEVMEQFRRRVPEGVLVQPVACNELAKKGGALHCVTAELVL